MDNENTYPSQVLEKKPAIDCIYTDTTHRLYTTADMQFF